MLVVDKTKIARRYAGKWLPIDVLGSIPWEIIFSLIALAGSHEKASRDEGQGRGADELLNVVRIFKLPKLLRLGRCFKFLERFEGAPNVARIVMLTLVLMLFVHWISCVPALTPSHPRVLTGCALWPAADACGSWSRQHRTAGCTIATAAGRASRPMRRGTRPTYGVSTAHL